MTEAEWLECTDPAPMLEFLRGQLSGRRFRLFACACLRRIWPLLTYEARRIAVEVAEKYADGVAGWEECAEAQDAVLGIGPAGYGDWDDRHAAAADHHAVYAAHLVLNHGIEYGASAELAAKAAAELSRTGVDAAYVRERAVQAHLFRDVSGHPFRPVKSDFAWGTPAVIALAQAVYDKRSMPEGTLDPSCLTVLADALEEAGCTDAAILSHLRGPGPHVRGCWALDLILGRE